MKPRIRCYQWDDLFVYYRLPNKCVYRIDIWNDGTWDKYNSWNEMFDLYNSVPWVGF